MAKGIGIILVVVGHSAFAGDNLLTWIASFHMPLFFIITGMLLQHTKEEEKKLSVIFRKKAKSILLPYISFSIIYLLMDAGMLLLHIGSNTMLDFTYAVIRTFTCYGISTLWFLPALFLGENSFLYIRKRYNHVITILVGIALAIIVGITHPIFDAAYSLYATIFNLIIGYILIWLYRSATAYVFIMMGYYVKKYIVEKEGIEVKELFLGIGFFLVGAAFSFANGRVDLNSVIFKNNIYFYISAFTGTMGVILICKNMKLWKPLLYTGKNSLIIMATHLDFKIMLAAIRVAAFINVSIIAIPVYLQNFCIAAVVIVLECIIVYLVNHYFCFLIGKKNHFNRKRFRVVK